MKMFLLKLKTLISENPNFCIQKVWQGTKDYPTVNDVRVVNYNIHEEFVLIGPSEVLRLTISRTNRVFVLYKASYG